ncbi:hypothetical protein [Cellulomonas sp. ICMP 17802]|uniref:hypothetical protein n=1 Tax=Cellulomonas sp. ICMP 17802 TaxID=3239199 RepID=UPI00351B19D6
MHAAMAFSGDDDEVAQARFRFSPPDNEAPGAVGVSGVIARSADAAILLVGLLHYANGVQIDLAIRRRLDPGPDDQMYVAYDAGLLAGVQLSDGRTVVAGRHGWASWPAADGPVLVNRSGGGGGREWSSTLWLTPAPPPGDLVIVVASPTLGIDESSVTVDAEALGAAADRAEILWPREPDQAQPAPYQPKVDVPPGGWFERALGDEPAD